MLVLLQFGSSLVNSIEPSYLCVRLLSSMGEYLRIIISIPHEYNVYFVCTQYSNTFICISYNDKHLSI
jgi:hypothetical protein